MFEKKNRIADLFFVFSYLPGLKISYRFKSYVLRKLSNGIVTLSVSYRLTLRTLLKINLQTRTERLT